MPTSWRSGIREADARRARRRWSTGFDAFTADEGAREVGRPAGQQGRASPACTRSGFRLGVATNDSTGGAEKTLLTLGVAQMFDAAYGYDAVANPEAGAGHHPSPSATSPA